MSKKGEPSLYKEIRDFKLIKLDFRKGIKSFKPNLVEKIGSTQGVNGTNQQIGMRLREVRV